MLARMRRGLHTRLAPGPGALASRWITSCFGLGGTTQRVAAWKGACGMRHMWPAGPQPYPRLLGGAAAWAVLARPPRPMRWVIHRRLCSFRVCASASCGRGSAAQSRAHQASTQAGQARALNSAPLPPPQALSAVLGTMARRTAPRVVLLCVAVLALCTPRTGATCVPNFNHTKWPSERLRGIGARPGGRGWAAPTGRRRRRRAPPHRAATRRTHLLSCLPLPLRSLQLAHRAERQPGCRSPGHLRQPSGVFCSWRAGYPQQRGLTDSGGVCSALRVG